MGQLSGFDGAVAYEGQGLYTSLSCSTVILKSLIWAGHWDTKPDLLNPCLQAPKAPSDRAGWGPLSTLGDFILKIQDVRAGKARPVPLMGS